jgi:hypothetical protein
MSWNTIIIRTSYYRARGRALLKGGGNITGKHLLPRDYSPYGPPIKGISLKYEPYQVWSYNSALIVLSAPLLLSSLALDL